MFACVCVFVSVCMSECVVPVPAALAAILCAVLAATKRLLAAIEAKAISLAFVVALLELPDPDPASASAGSSKVCTMLNRRSNSLTFTAALFSLDSSPVCRQKHYRGKSVQCGAVQCSSVGRIVNQLDFPIYA